MLEISTAAPDLDLVDAAGTPVRLRDYHDRAHVLLYFMRATTCPVCVRHVRDLARHVDEFTALDARILVVVPEGLPTARSWAAGQRLPFPVVTGAGDSVHEAIGMRRAVFGTVQQSGTVVIDRAGLVRYVKSVTLPLSGYDRAALLRVLTTPA
ncbi:peroxiredoxin [Virgisporangium aliadipatigenens]|uniref:thioredoxin-dependent peroxiredoxin n=1 Tax=Virgisporangium aliadipatigenens TaxID=741659 RepID=A0A8J4DQL8_9ACTN|nr:peroxiredoxin family protein [Virgisporangium aliadipatigenens]GIJ46136.1 peroxiredoxin [Virgisporangium aliadipatigenens]